MESTWTDIQFSMDLLTASQREANFLRMIDRKAPVLYEEDVVRNAIRRYEQYWLPLQVIYQWRSQRGGGTGGTWHLGLHPKPRGDCWGLRPRRKIVAGGSAPRPPRERGLGRSPNGAWVGAPAGVWGRSPQQRSCGKAAPGLAPRAPRSWLRP